MLFCSNKYLRLFLQKSVLSIGLILVFGLSAYCQDNLLKKDSFNLHLSPLLISAFKKPVKANPLLNEHLKPTKNELMDWSAYYLTDDYVQNFSRRRETRYFKVTIMIRFGKVDASIFKRKPPVRPQGGDDMF